MLKTKAVFERKLDCFQPQDCVIEAIEELSAAEFKDFCENMLVDRDFIADRIGDMYLDGNGVQHGLLVLVKARMMLFWWTAPAIPTADTLRFFQTSGPM